MSKPSSGDIRNLEQTVFNHPLSVASLQVTVPSDRAPVISIGWWCIWTWFLPWICPPKSWPFEWIYHDDWPCEYDVYWHILTCMGIDIYWHILILTYMYIYDICELYRNQWLESHFPRAGPIKSAKASFQHDPSASTWKFGSAGSVSTNCFKVIKQGNHGMLPWKSMKYGGFL